MIGQSTTLVLSTDSDIFKFLKGINSGGSAPLVPRGPQ